MSEASLTVRAHLFDLPLPHDGSIRDEHISLCCRENRGMLTPELLRHVGPWLQAQGFDLARVRVICYENEDYLDFCQ